MFSDKAYHTYLHKPYDNVERNRGSLARIIYPFFFAERTVSVIVYLEILELYVLLQIEWDNLIFQQDANVVRDFLDEEFPRR